MGQTIAKAKKDGQTVEAQFDTNMGDGPYYLYEFGDHEAELHPPNPIKACQTRDEILQEFVRSAHKLHDGTPTGG